MQSLFSQRQNKKEIELLYILWKRNNMRKTAGIINSKWKVISNSFPSLYATIQNNSTWLRLTSLSFISLGYNYKFAFLIALFLA